MKDKILHYIKEIVVFILVMTVIANIISLYKSSDLSKTPLDLSHITLLDGSMHGIDSSKPLLLHVWATWCPTCKLEASNINTISQNYQVLTIAVKSGSPREIEKFLSDNDLDFLVSTDTNGLIAQKLNVAVYPTTFIYNKNSELVFSEVGYTSTWGLWIRMWWASL